MQVTKKVLMDGQTVGTAFITRKGLYLHIRCCCNFPDKKIRRIRMCIENEVFDLGVCIPEKNLFVINKAIPLKRIGAGEISFHVFNIKDSQFFSLTELDQFNAICKLQNACLSVKNGEAGIMIKDQSQGQRDSDLNP